jgi:hypothetical protein
MGERKYISSIFDLCTRWRQVVGFTPLPLYPVDRRLGGHQSLSGHCGIEKKLVPQWESELQPSLY